MLSEIAFLGPGYLPADIADELGIRIVPLTIRFGDEELEDRTFAGSQVTNCPGEVSGHASSA